MAAYEKLWLSPNSDGSFHRNYPIPFSPPSPDLPPSSSSSSYSALSKDVPLNKTHGTSIRIFIPTPPSSDHRPHSKLPVIVYFHAGGFVLCSPAITPIHNFTSRIASHLPAIVLSVDHRLAPEHRLPAAYDDALDALLWLRHQALISHSSSSSSADEVADPWLKDHADFSRCFLMGSSSGGNIAYHLALRALSLDLRPVEIAGLIMDQPFFGGEERTESEAKMGADDRFVPLDVTDLMWELALPEGADRDHEYSKLRPLAEGQAERMPRCLIRGYVGDPLIDRIRGVAAMMEEGGVRVVRVLDEDGHHGVEFYDEAKAQGMVDDIKRFVIVG